MRGTHMILVFTLLIGMGACSKGQNPLQAPGAPGLQPNPNWDTDPGDPLPTLGFTKQPDGKVVALLEDHEITVLHPTAREFLVGTTQGLFRLPLLTPKANFAEASAQVFEVEDVELTSQRITSLETHAEDTGLAFWIGTEEGLIYIKEFSDSETTPLTFHLKKGASAEEVSLPSNLITALASDQRGGVWIGTPEGLAYLTWMQGEPRVSPISFTKNNQKQSIGRLAWQDQNHLWVATRPTGLYQLDLSRPYRQDHLLNADKPSTPFLEDATAPIQALSVDPNHGLWIATTQALHPLKKTKFSTEVEKLWEKLELLSDIVSFEGTANDLWIGTKSELIHIFVTEKEGSSQLEVTTLKEEFEEFPLTTLLVHSETKSVLIGTKAGLLRYNY